MTQIVPLKDAVDRLSNKTPIGSVLKSADWAKVPLALRERAQFSSGIVSMKFLGGIQDRISGQVKQQREKLANGKEATFDRSSFIDSLRTIAREEGITPEPGKEGTLQDVTSIPRLGMIYDMQNAMASGYAQYKLDQNEGALALYPAYRFGPSSARVPRETWRSRWNEAGSAVGWEGANKGGDMVALKTSPIWASLSRFGVPWPPFDFGSTRELEDVDHDTAVELGLLQPGEVPSPSEDSFNENLKSSVQDISPKGQGILKRFFGDQVKFADGEATWKGETSQPDIAAQDYGTNQDGG